MLESLSQKYLESIVCQHLKQEAIEHIRSCSECKRGIQSVIDNFPILEMLGGSVARDLENFLTDNKEGAQNAEK